MGIKRESDLTIERVVDAFDSLGKMLSRPDVVDAPTPVDEKEDSLDLFGYLAVKKNEALGGVQYLYYFPNGYGASIVRHSGSYGYSSGLWELAVIKYADLSPDSKQRLDYTTTITDDVLGYLTESKVKNILDQISKLEVK
jgi:hypothetical protein